MLYVVHGEDEFSISEQLAAWKSRLGEPSEVSLNTTLLDGRQLQFQELMQACEALPFFGQARLVVVEGFWSQFEQEDKRSARRASASEQALIDGLKQRLPTMPPTTRLVFVESTSLSQGNPLHEAFGQGNDKVHIKEFVLPRTRQLAPWLQKRMAAKGGEITSRAAQALAERVGPNLRQLDQELDKALAYVGYARPVDVEDVRSVVVGNLQTTIFHLVDAIGEKSAERASQALHELLDLGAAPQYILFMVVRQFRILVQVKDLRSGGATLARIQSELGIRHRFVVDKAVRQSANFSMADLRSIYTHLADVDDAIKTGRLSELLALDMLVAELCHMRRGA
jgi:DNA polymerase-3 subunit delta